MIQTRIRLAAIVCAVMASSVAEAASEEAMAQLDFRKVVAEAKAKVFPAVVFIKCVRESHESGKKIAQEVSGSGVIIDPSGEVLTNWHVVDKAIEVRCLLYDGTAVDAEIVGTDKDLDMALIKLKLPDRVDPLPYAELGESGKLSEGDFVMAMGAPWGLSRSVSIGIISCTHRFLPDSSEYSHWLQTDAAINPGNSGGPLVDTHGRVIGINTLGMQMGDNVGFSIPSDTLSQVLPRIREHKAVNWSWVGVQLQAIRDFNRNIYFDGDKGVIVAGTDPESPARRAGIQPRDRIMAVGGVEVNALTDEQLPAVRRLIGLLPLNEAVSIDIIRDGESMTIELTPREKGQVEGNELDCPRWDLSVKTINQFDNPDLHFYRKEGVFIYGIKYPGNAARSDLSRNDIIVKIDGQAVETLDDIAQVHKKTLENLDNKPRIMFTVLRNGLMRQVIVDISRDYERE